MEHFKQLYEKNRELSQQYPGAIILYQCHRGLTAVDGDARYLVDHLQMNELTVFIDNRALIYTGFSNSSLDNVMGALVRAGNKVALVTRAFGSEKILRSVRVTYANGDEITTSMAAHLTDEDIRAYFAIGKIFNIGRGIEDDLQEVAEVEILF